MERGTKGWGMGLVLDVDSPHSHICCVKASIYYVDTVL